MKLFLTLSICTFANFCWSQVPDTEIYLVDIKKQENGYNFSSPVNISNREGYDNQPSFTMDAKNILYTSIREDNQADIYSYNIETATTKRLTNTMESEYSPVALDEKYFSVVRVESDGTTQRLWQFSFAGDEPSLMLEHMNPVGYYYRYNSSRFALFIVGEPHFLTVVANGSSEKVCDNVGRCILRIPNTDNISYIQKSDKEWWLKKMNPSLESSNIITTLVEVEDYIWTPDGRLWMGKAGKLYEFIPKISSEWQEIADFSQTEIGDFNRMAINPQGNKLAIVSMR